MKTAVILFNLGGPDGPEAVQPFLYNLFNDPAIISAPWPIRPWLARRISRKRAPVAREIYARIGGRSPLVPETEAQATALEAVLGQEFKVFIAMRYWRPFTAEAVAKAKAWGADRVVLLPLYPQYSTTTTRSALREWRRAARGWAVPTEEVCCYPAEPGLVAAMTDLVRRGVAEAQGMGKVRVLFSAHGLPKKIVEAGDPYPIHVKQTAEAVATAAGLEDWAICYQSRVGPLEWIGPSTEQELERAAADGRAVVVVPVAFVSEHSETLVELDMEYRELAAGLGIPGYVRVPAVGSAAPFIAGLARLVRDPSSLRGQACAEGKCVCLGEGR